MPFFNLYYQLQKYKKTILVQNFSVKFHLTFILYFQECRQKVKKIGSIVNRVKEQKRSVEKQYCRA
jgi:hypothetical protein